MTNLTKGLLALLFVVICEVKGQIAKVNGSLTDGRGAPLTHIRVIFKPLHKSDSIIAITDTSGLFTTKLPQGNTYKIFAELYGQRVSFNNILSLKEYGQDIELEMNLQIIMDTLYKEIIILPDIHFEFDKAIIKPESYPILDSVAQWLKENPNMIVEIAGHTDSIGSAEYNLSLSRRRAEAVRQYLIKKGISPHRLYARGYGETQPIADNGTEEGRAKNRRVEIRVIRK